MHHFDKNHKHSTNNHNLPQHQKGNGGYPSHPAPGGANTSSPQKPSYFSRIKEKFQKKPEAPATKEEIQQLKLNAQREQYRFMHKNYTQKTKQLKGGGGGWQGLFAPDSAPRGRGRGSTGSRDLGFLGGGSSNNDMFGGGEGALSAFGAGPQPKGRGRNKEPEFGSGLTDMF